MQKIYQWCLKEEAGEKARQLIKNALYAFMGVGGATLITFSFTVIAIRLLGPTEFGKLNIIVSIGELLALPMLWGLSTTVARYLGAEPEKQKTIIGTSFWIVILLTTFFSIAFSSLSNPISSLFKIPDLILTFAIIYAPLNAFFHLFQSYFQGLLKFKILSILWIVSAIVFALVISFSLFYLKSFNFISLFSGQMMRLTTIILVGLTIFRANLTTFENSAAKKIFHYGTYQMFSVLAGFFSLGLIDNIMINYFLGPAAVGIYAAYYIAFNIVISKLLTPVIQILLPAAAGYQNVFLLYTKISQIFKKTIVFIVAGIFILIWTLFKLYGQDYHFDYRLAALIAISVTLYLFLTILGVLIASIGLRGARLGIVFALTSAGINVLLNALLIPRFGLFGVTLATLVATSVVLLMAIYVLKKQKNQNYK